MRALWIGFAIVSVVIAVALALRRRGGVSSADLDVGSVSEGWLAEQRGRKDDH